MNDLNCRISKLNDRPWPDLQAFLAVARNGALGPAASQIGTSPPTIGRRIAALEKQLSVSLFTKSTTGYRLTEVGRDLLPAAEAVEEAIIGFARRREGLREAFEGVIRVSAPESVISLLLAPHLNGLLVRHPKLRLEFTTGPERVSLPRRDADVAVRIGNPGESELLARKVGEVRYKVYVGAKAIAEIESLPNPVELPWIGWGEAYDELAISIAAAKIFDPARQIAAATTMHLQVTLAKELGAALVAPEFVARSYPDLVEIVADVVLTQPLWLVSSAEFRNTARIAALSDWIARSLQGMASHGRLGQTQAAQQLR